MQRGPRLSAEQKKLNPAFPSIIKDGFKAERVDDDDEVSVARDNQILTDAQVSKLLRAAREIDAEQGFEGDLYRLVACLAATGARFAQARRMRVGDVQVKEHRLMVPGSYKGRGGNGGSVPFPVGEDIIEILLQGILDRPKEAILFERWSYDQEAGSIVWRRSKTWSVEDGRTHSPVAFNPRARKATRSYSLRVATFQHRPRLAKSTAYSARC